MDWEVETANDPVGMVLFPLVFANEKWAVVGLFLDIVSKIVWLWV
jgi:hypothetical protein